MKRGGSSRPLGSLVLGSRSSSKKLWAHASNGVILDDGVYSRRRETNSIASGGVRGRNTCNLIIITSLLKQEHDEPNCVLLTVKNINVFSMNIYESHKKEQFAHSYSLRWFVTHKHIFSRQKFFLLIFSKKGKVQGTTNSYERNDIFCFSMEYPPPKQKQCNLFTLPPPWPRSTEEINKNIISYLSSYNHYTLIWHRVGMYKKILSRAIQVFFLGIPDHHHSIITYHTASIIKVTANVVKQEQ